MNKLHLDYKDQFIDGKFRRVTTIKDEKGTINFDFFHEIEDVVVPPSLNADASVLSQILFLMSNGMDLYVHGELSQTMFWNLEELMLAWNRWMPNDYKKINIFPDQIIQSNNNNIKHRAIAAFSGGVDATFTALRHTRHLPIGLRYPLTDVVMVHGFDVDLDRTDYLKALINRTQPLLDELGLKLHIVRTNSKNMARQNWNLSHGMELAACLQLFSSDFTHGLIGSAEPYEALIIPWGSGPVMDHLFSSSNMQIIHDSAGFSRTDKVCLIADSPIACKTLKVCWAGENQSENCCECEKCMRTMMNFLATGKPIPMGFSKGLDIKKISTIKLYNEPQRAELNGIIKYADEHGVKGDWLLAAKKRLRRGLSKDTPPLYRRAVGKTLSKIGLKEPIKRLLKR